MYNHPDIPGLCSSVILPAILFFLVFQFIKAAIKANAVMAAYRISTLWAFPLLLFFFKKPGDPVIPDVLEVLNHAHSVIFSVALIDVLEISTGKIRTLMAVFYLSVQD